MYLSRIPTTPLDMAIDFFNYDYETAGKVAKNILYNDVWLMYDWSKLPLIQEGLLNIHKREKEW